MTIQPQAKNLFSIHFDGGYNGQCYGSWEITFNGFSKKMSRVIYQAPNATSNVAEYLSMMDALSFLRTVVEKKDYRVEIFTDSKLVEGQMVGSYRCNLPHLQTLRDRAREFCAQFGTWSIHWNSRVENVKRFGH